MYRPISDFGKHLINIQQLSDRTSTHLYQICLLATDMDGTLTKYGKFTSKLLDTLENLAAVKVPVLIVTGRSAGWVSAISSLMPIVGAIAENGGLFYPSSNSEPVTLTPIADLTSHREHLARTFANLQTYFPQIQESADNRFRVTDWTFDLTSLTTDELKNIGNLCEQMGWGFTYSNVQCHIKPQGQDKAIGLLKVLRQYFPTYFPEQVITVGDSPNDESLFNHRYFPISVGVANIREYATQLQHQPTYITTAAEGDGFCELCSYILQSCQH
ncbi:HAD family phosphatase [Anabaena sp. UHCC 0253]|uniref:HAD-IIB family hydrolase n=1 Tax=Anabaena sp. UHCC 0253 TaxID=2590019 RepID=UPI001446B640|nr:HAD family hydrolase [Anabaena sp. UHCC 0253]MTJ54753.1 HAD family phosphatase [Anabaena sp. UHCC 0253]